MFFNCLRSSIFLENSRFYFPFSFTDCLQYSGIPVKMGSVPLDVAMIRHNRTILRDQLPFLYEGRIIHVDELGQTFRTSSGLCVSSIKTGTRRIMRPDELPFYFVVQDAFRRKVRPDT